MSDAVGSVDYGTAIRTTHIRPIVGEDVDVSWTRTAPHDAHPFSSTAFDVPERPICGPHFATGTGDDLTRRYRLPGRKSLAASALFGHHESVDWAAVYRQWGSLLARLHCTPQLDISPVQAGSGWAVSEYHTYWRRAPTGASGARAVASASSRLA